jgi:hypothetical protein
MELEENLKQSSNLIEEEPSKEKPNSTEGEENILPTTDADD